MKKNIVVASILILGLVLIGAIYTQTQSNQNGFYVSEEEMVGDAQILSPLPSDDQNLQQDQILGDTVTVTSQSLGVEFQYLTKDGEQTFTTKEENRRIYVYPNGLNYLSGQFVEVFDKPANQTLELAIEESVLTTQFRDSCEITTSDNPEFATMRQSHPTTSYAILVPVNNDPTLTLEERAAACPEGYGAVDGLAYFFVDQNFPNKLGFVQAGDYAIKADQGGKLWQDTIKFVE